MTQNKDKTLTGLRKAATLLKKVTDMVEQEAGAVEVMQQNLAVIGLLKAAHQSMLEGHMQQSVRNAFSLKSIGRKEKMIDEIMRLSALGAK